MINKPQPPEVDLIALIHKCSGKRTSTATDKIDLEPEKVNLDREKIPIKSDGELKQAWDRYKESSPLQQHNTKE